MALHNGHADTVKIFCDIVLGSDLDAEQKMQLLTAKRQDGTPGLFMALQKGHADVVKNFCNLVLGSDLDAEQKMQLLAAKRQDGTPGLFMALQAGHADVVKNFCNLVLGSDLDAKQKMQLLAAKCQDGTSGLFVALQNGHADTVKNFCNLVLGPDLNAEQKMQLGTPGLYALQKGRTDTIYMALQNGHADADAVENFCDIVIYLLSFLLKIYKDGKKVMGYVKAEMPSQYVYSLQKLCETVCKYSKLSLAKKVLFCIATGNVNWAIRLIKTGQHNIISSWTYDFFSISKGLQAKNLRNFMTNYPETKIFFKKYNGNFLVAQNKVIQNHLIKDCSVSDISASLTT